MTFYKALTLQSQDQGQGPEYNTGHPSIPHLVPFQSLQTSSQEALLYPASLTRHFAWQFLPILFCDINPFLWISNIPLYEMWQEGKGTGHNP